MSEPDELRHALPAGARELAHRLFDFSRAFPPDSDACVGWALGEMLATVVEHRGDPADLAWLLEIFGDCTALIAATIRDEHLATGRDGTA